MKDERELLTRKRIAAQLAWEAKHSVLGAAIVCAIGALLLTVFCRLVIPKAHAAWSYLAILPCLAAFMITFTHSLLLLGMIRRGEFVVAEDRLVDVQTDRLNKRSAVLYGDYSIWNQIFFGRGYSRDCYEHIFQFESGRRFVANAQTYHGTRLETVAEFSMPGDTFFLVMYEDKPQKIVLLYSAKIYRYQEGE